MTPTITTRLERAASLIFAADAVLIGAGAGMGVDSGLPDFRGPEGFWRAYPPLHAEGALPRCPRCGGVSRPNVLMFGDGGWIPDRTDAQHGLYGDWLARQRDRRVVAIEIGAGTAVPTVRYACQREESHLIRINPRESQGPAGTVSIPMGGLEALTAIRAFLG